jgi:hypothetical protein
VSFLFVTAVSRRKGGERGIDLIKRLLPTNFVLRRLSVVIYQLSFIFQPSIDIGVMRGYHWLLVIRMEGEIPTSELAQKLLYFKLVDHENRQNTRYMRTYDHSRKSYFIFVRCCICSHHSIKVILQKADLCLPASFLLCP